MSSALKAYPDHRVYGVIREFISRRIGVQLGECQREMLRSRLARRIRELGLNDVHEYESYLVANRAEEEEVLVSLLTTHHSYFFREFAHFEFLQSTALDSLVEAARARGDYKIRIWSAACSRGQEAYSIAMLMDKYLRAHAPDVNFEIIGTDVDSESVAVAQNGVYPYQDIKEIPVSYLAGNWCRGSGEIAGFVKVKDTLKSRCSFFVDNLIDLSAQIRGKKFDVIFCRNVFIYFEATQIKKVCQDLVSTLTPGGFLFIGISESIIGCDLPLKAVGPSIFIPQGSAPQVKVTKAPLLRVLCVDDSPTILTLLKKILVRESGFEVVGTAANGIEAAREVARLKPDLVTLDIHMPVQDGLEYLRQNARKGHPPVIMVTSVSREDSGLAQQAVSLGAVDWVEKPTLKDLSARGEEIRGKLRSASLHREDSLGGAHQLVDREFSAPVVIAEPEKVLRIILATYQDRTRLNMLFDSWPQPQPPTVIHMDFGEVSFEKAIKELSSAICFRVQELGSPHQKLVCNSVSVTRHSGLIAELLRQAGGVRASVLALEGSDLRLVGEIAGFANCEVIVEEGGTSPGALLRAPFTSLAYMSQYFLSRGNPR